MVAEIVNQGHEILHGDKYSEAAGTVKQIVKLNACVGKRRFADRARPSRFADKLEAVFIDGRRTGAVTVVRF
jgi:hypothetical protein